VSAVTGNVLALDTATEAIVLALRCGPRLYVRAAREGLRHAQSLAPQVEQLLAQAGLVASELDLVVAGTGPGSFTGLRIALATARGIARGAGCPLVGVPTLDALAWARRFWPALVVPVIDARKGRVYAAFYLEGRRLGGFVDVAPNELAAAAAAAAAAAGVAAPAPGGGAALLTGPHAAAPQLPASPAWAVDPAAGLPDPAALLELGWERHARGGAADVEPIYLRRSQAEQAAG
jgi:tRNA threonylcarbamoyladenosine biosynthesis protein TsaB